jgi:hypothetical protein
MKKISRKPTLKVLKNVVVLQRPFVLYGFLNKVLVAAR